MNDLNYKNDQLFCDVRKNKILSAKPILVEKVVREWFFHQRERTNIYLKKEILKQPPAWTDDHILQKYKFVNTKRTWDRQTKWLLANVINNPNVSYRDKLLNCFLFRVLNKSETLDSLGGPIFFSKLTLQKINIDFRNILEQKHLDDPSYVFFSAAYILGGPKVNFGKFIEQIEKKTELNMVIRMLKFVYYNQDEIVNGITNSKNQKNIYDHLCTFKGIGSFLGYQIFIDFTYIKEFPFTEHHFVISGPGCERGINWIFQDRDGLTSEECLFWFTLNQFEIAEKFGEKWDVNKLFEFLPVVDRKYTLMDMENSGACEIDKRCRTLFNDKRPKQIYRYPNYI